MDLYVSLWHYNLAETFRQVLQFPGLRAITEADIEVDFEPREATPDEVEKYITECERTVQIYWTSPRRFASYDRDEIVKFKLVDIPLDAQYVLDLLAPLDWSVACFRALYGAWEGHGNRFDTPDFGDGHFDLGWGCAFKGYGHDSLVSRRWLDFGPWHLLHGPHDTTLVQFHDLHTDSETAKLQARPGHLRMADSDIGGYIRSDFRFTLNKGGLYFPQEKQLRVVVVDREVSQREMLEACAAVRYQVLGPNQPLESACFVFTEAVEQAYEHLHELWLRQLQCRAFVDGVEQRIDQAYRAEPVKPAWVQRLEQTQSQA